MVSKFDIFLPTMLCVVHVKKGKPSRLLQNMIPLWHRSPIFFRRLLYMPPKSNIFWLTTIYGVSENMIPPVVPKSKIILLTTIYGACEDVNSPEI